jgi:Mrp family chromosome partitioning ATPase
VDRIARALELAQARRERLGQRVVAIDPSLDARAEAVSAGNETDVGTSQLLSVDPAFLESERILPPNAGGPYGAHYKLLRTQVLQRLDQLNASTLAILSASAADGKTLTAINLAIAIAAEHGRTVLLVDCDLRNPSVHRRLGFEPGSGVEDCLQLNRPLHQAIVRIAGYQRLAVLAARAPVEHSSELLGSQRTAALVEELRQRYGNRIIIFDLPPVCEADDALAFSRSVQAGLFVIGEGRTRRADIKRGFELMQELPVIGTVLNGSRDAPGIDRR